jgi:uncharacterized protein
MSNATSGPLGAVAQGTIPPAAPNGPVGAAERIETLDVLRGIALFGMFLVHFYDFSVEATTPFGRALGNMNDWFFANRFMTMFAILFGAGFAVQLSRAEARGEQVAWRYVRRLLALLVFGIISTDLFGFHVLLDYAIWGLPLLLVRSWSNRAIVFALIVCLMSTPLYWAGRAGYDVATGGVDRYRADAGLCPAFGLPFVSLPLFSATTLCQGERRRRAEARREAPGQPNDYLSVVRRRFVRTWDSWAHPWPMTFLPTGYFPLFLIGVLGFRMKVFQRPGDHRRLIGGLMVFGAVSSILSTWFLYQYLFSMRGMHAPLAVQVALGFLVMPLARDVFLSFVYIGTILLLVASSPAWLPRLRAFGVTGRMALTNYILQVAIIDLMVRSPYGLHLRINPEYAPLAALALFAFDFAFSSWWLSRYRFGPLEWIWRSVTYWKIPALQRVMDRTVA